jgi:hypothetical protein
VAVCGVCGGGRFSFCDEDFDAMDEDEARRKKGMDDGVDFLVGAVWFLGMARLLPDATLPTGVTV